MTTSSHLSISSTALSETILQKALDAAKKFNIPYITPDRCETQYILTFTDQRLELRANPANKKSETFAPIYVDFVQGSTGYRHQRNTTIKQPLARAVGVKSGFRPDVFDATAGLGIDGFVLASLGCKVILSERSPILHALLEDGLERAANNERTHEIVTRRITLLSGNSINNLIKMDNQIHTVYLDPMYPHSAKSALNKKEMRVIRDLVGDDEDGPELLKVALEVAGNRVVVKRPKGAPRLDGSCENPLEPSHEIQMKNSRFDVYLTAHLKRT
ncbi:class I SAM-dependent methyltransferase [Desulfosediminicola sp.]|uniref:class I SAM-dependent methyltransferase n=1 Tax=Desulfosediminicola sp. TaxID=2886825 RepID=UPI003AF22371